MSQLVRKGTPFIHGVISTIMDMRTAVTCYGAPIPKPEPLLKGVLYEINKIIQEASKRRA